MDKLRGLGQIGASLPEAAIVLGCDHATLWRRLRDDPDAKQAWDEGFTAANVGMRRLQYQIAMQGNIAMLIWLGKQRLGQSNVIRQDGAMLEIVEAEESVEDRRNTIIDLIADVANSD